MYLLFSLNTKQIKKTYRIWLSHSWLCLDECYSSPPLENTTTGKQRFKEFGSKKYKKVSYWRYLAAMFKSTTKKNIMYLILANTSPPKNYSTLNKHTLSWSIVVWSVGEAAILRAEGQTASCWKRLNQRTQKNEHIVYLNSKPPGDPINQWVRILRHSGWLTIA